MKFTLATSFNHKRFLEIVTAKNIQGDKSRNQLRKFPEKVIKYLWDDAFKFNREDLFNSNYNSLEDVIEDFLGKSGFERFNIFKTDVINQLRPTETKQATSEPIEPANDASQQ